MKKEKIAAMNYGNEILSVAYEKFFRGGYITYEEFVIMLSTNDELWFEYDGLEYFIEHTSPNVVSMCVTRINGPNDILERNEPFASIIELLEKFRIGEKRIRDIWDDVVFTNGTNINNR
jgi:hypothetical protein